MPPTTQRDDSRLFADCQAVLGHEFRDADLLREALTHASGANHRLASNERLEFLGDAILGAVVCELLFRKYPDYQEGELTRIKSIVVSRRDLRQDRRIAVARPFPVPGQGDGLAGSDPAVASG